jgi:SRSO17 transposase
MTVREFTQQDEQEFEEYRDALGEVMNHERRLLPLTSYCTGLLLPLDSKTMEAMAATLAPQRTLALHHRLQNFITDAPWSDAAVLAAVRAQVLPAMLKHAPVRSWIIDDTGLPKKGRHSVGTARQYCGQLGKVDNCQVLVTLSVANGMAALPIDVRLYLPQAWTQDAQRCQQAGVPLDITFATKPTRALEQIRAAHAAGVPAGVVLGDEAFGANGPFRRGVRALGLDYALGVPAASRSCPPPTAARPAAGAARPAHCQCANSPACCRAQPGAGSPGATAPGRR